jgi:ketosteroid isomerase-like protein
MRNPLLLTLALSAGPWCTIAAQQSKDEAAIRNQEALWRRAVDSKDTSAIKSFYTEDGIYAPDNAGGPYRGSDSVSARWAREFSLPGFHLERTPTRIEVASSGDMAQELGTYVVRALRDGEPREAHGNYATAWRKVRREVEDRVLPVER